MPKSSGKIYQKYKMRQYEIISDVKISPYASKAKKGATYKALWDTGSDFTAITKKVVDDLKLRAIREIPVNTANGMMMSKEYVINVILPDNISKLVRATECIMNDDTDILIGMDIITDGDFAISSDVQGNMYFAYRSPSEGEIKL